MFHTHTYFLSTFYSTPLKSCHIVHLTISNAFRSSLNMLAQMDRLFWIGKDSSRLLIVYHRSQMNALTRLVKLRCRGANKTPHILQQVDRRRRFIATNIWRTRSESKTRVAHRRTNASGAALSFPFCGSRASARARVFSSARRKYLAYFCLELIRTVIPASGCALKILSTNNPSTRCPPAFVHPPRR